MPETAQPATPILASTLYTTCRARGKRRKLKSGHTGVDERVLLGGLAYGRDGVCCVSGESAVTGELALSFLSAHLLDHSKAPAYYIDVLGAFSPLRLQQSLKTSLRQRQTTLSGFTHDGGYMYRRGGGAASGEATEGQREGRSETEPKVEAMMSRVDVMRVFDFFGLTEALGEVREALEMRSHREPDALDAIEGRTGIEETPSEAQDSRSAQEPQQKIPAKRKFEIADSQALYGEEDPLTPSAASSPAANSDLQKPQTVTPPGPSHARAKIQPPSAQAALDPTSSAPSSPPPHLSDEPAPVLLIINNVTQALSPIIRKNHIQGQALLSHLLRTLRHLASSHDAVVLLLNTSVSASTSAPGQSTESGGRSGLRDQEPGPSVFAGRGGTRPALGRTFAFGLDVHLFVTVGESGGRGEPEAVEEEGGDGVVVEVVADRRGGRVGKWTAL